MGLNATSGRPQYESSTPAVQKAYKGKRRVSGTEVFAGEKAKHKFDNWLPDDTVEMPCANSA